MTQLQIHMEIMEPESLTHRSEVLWMHRIIYSRIVAMMTHRQEAAQEELQFSQ